jgi:hypothetical protein
MENTAANALYDLLVTRDFEPEILDSQGKTVTDPAQAELFSFDWKTPEKNYGTVVVLLGADQNLEVYYGDNLGRAMDSDDRQDWYDFLAQMKQFASRNMMTFNVNNINRLKYTMQGMAAIKEGLFEGYYGNRKISYSDQPKQTKLIIKHSRPLAEGEARYRNIDSIFIETDQGERFRVPSRSLMHGKILARHVAEGGTPYDAFGQHITEMVSELATLSRFLRASRGRTLNETANGLVETARQHYQEMRSLAHRMISSRGYRESRDAWRPDEIRDSENTVGEIREMFLEQTLDSRIEEALPILSRFMKDKSMKEVQEFESWADTITEGTWSLPETPEQLARLEDLMTEPMPVGADATNATEQLYDLVGDDVLFDRLADLAARDPDADARPIVQQRLEEMGIELTTPAEPAQATNENSFGTPIGGAMDQPLDSAPGEFELVDIQQPPTEGNIHELRSFNSDLLPGVEDLRPPREEYSDTLYYRDPITGGIFSFYYAFGQPRIRGTGGMPEDRVDEIVQTLESQPTREDLDTDGVMMTRPSNMSSESLDRQDFNRLVELAKG